MHKPPIAELQRVDYDVKIDLYRQRAWALAAKSQGLEEFIYKLFGTDLIASWALALDPWEKFTFTVYKVSLLSDTGTVPGTPNSVRTRYHVGVQYQTRVEYWKETNISYGYRPDPSAYPFDYLLTGPVTSLVTSGTTSYASQPLILGFIKDTTDKSRPVGTILGEFELFSPEWLSSPSGYTFKYQDNHVQNHIGVGATGVQNSQTIKHKMGYTRGPTLVLDKVSTLAMLVDCQTRATLVMAKNALSMLDKCLPESRTFNLFYQISELKDLPQTIRGSLQVWLAFEHYCGTSLFKDLQKSARNWRNPELLTSYHRILGSKVGFKFDPGTDIDILASNAYLTFKFGWQSMYQAVSKLLPSPTEIARDVNRLINHIGRDISFRTKRKWTEEVGSTPTITGDLWHWETVDLDGHTPHVEGYREVELRCMANCHIQFPQVNVPKLRRDLFLKKMGLWPTPGDILDLIPWTWLIDWFGGLGDYVHLMDTIRSDRTLVNYGFMTYREVSHISGHFTGKFVGTHSTNFDHNPDPPTGSYTEEWKRNHDGKLSLKYHLRKSLSEVAKVSTFWDSDLNSNQKAIIGALATKYGSGASHSGKR